MWEQYRKTAVGIQIVIAIVTVAVLLWSRVLVVGGVFFQNALEEVAVVFCQQIEVAPSGLVAGNGVVGLPLAARVSVEVVAGVEILIEVGRFKAEAGIALRRAGRGS